MTCSDKLELLKSRLSPVEGGCRYLDEQELFALLNEYGGDVDMASYAACMRLAQCSALVTPELETESSRDYWLSLARFYRPNKTRALSRSDERRARR